MKVTKYANLYGIANAVRRYSKECPNISESTARGWLIKFHGELTRKVPIEEVVISKNCGRISCNEGNQMRSCKLF